jgi:hypothetical protein
MVNPSGPHLVKPALGTADVTLVTITIPSRVH